MNRTGRPAPPSDDEEDGEDDDPSRDPQEFFNGGEARSASCSVQHAVTADVVVV